MAEEPNNTYRITWGLDAIRHLSGSLYSNAAAVLTEVVANSWDADAERVDITFNKKEGYIEFLDDGIGMSLEDINKKYLTVGYQRRNIEGKEKDADVETDKGRLVMGRKGLGKLALFSLAQTVEVQTMKDGKARGFRMDIGDIESKQGEEYNPKVLSENEIKIKKEGTLIRLGKLQEKRIRFTERALRKRLSYRFSIIGKEYKFKVYLNGEPITKDERAEFIKSEMVWKIGDFKGSIPNAKHTFSLPTDRLNDWEADWNVKGWIATLLKPGDLKDEEAGNLNKIVVLARGRLFEEDIFPKLSDNRYFARYLIGEINADFLDQDKMPDIATSDRQRVLEEDERYIQLMKFLKKQFSTIVENWDDAREKKVIKMTEKNQAVKQYGYTIEETNPKEKKARIKILKVLVENYDIDSDSFKNFLPLVLTSESSQDILNRKSWIPNSMSNIVPANKHRERKIFDELSQSSLLDVTKARNATAVLARTFIEVSVAHYIVKNSIKTVDENGRSLSLPKRINAVTDHMESHRKKEEPNASVKQGENLMNMDIVKIETLNHWVHSNYYEPLLEDLEKLWNNCEQFIINCWKN